MRIAKNHPLPDGNKRLAWQALTMFCALNGYTLEVPPNEAVDVMLGIAAGDLDDGAVVGWLADGLPGGVPQLQMAAALTHLGEPNLAQGSHDGAAGHDRKAGTHAGMSTGAMIGVSMWSGRGRSS